MSIRLLPVLVTKVDNSSGQQELLTSRYTAVVSSSGLSQQKLPSLFTSQLRRKLHRLARATPIPPQHQKPPQTRQYPIQGPTSPHSFARPSQQTFQLSTTNSTTNSDSSPFSCWSLTTGKPPGNLARMNSPAQNTAYTPLESLLLFHYLSTHGTHPSSFALISQLILKNPVIKAEATFDRGRLSPDALREFYHVRLAEAESEFALSERNFNGDGKPGSQTISRKSKTKNSTTAPSEADKLRLVKVLTSRLYERYRKVSLRQIQELEERYQHLNHEIDEINEGKWDERLAREEQARTRDRSKSRMSFDFRDKVSSPPSDRRIIPVDSMIEGSSTAAGSGEMALLPTKPPLPSVSAPILPPIPDPTVTSIKPEKSTPPVPSNVVTPQVPPPHTQLSQAQVPCPTSQMRYEHTQPAPAIGAGEVLGHQPSFPPQKPHTHNSMSPSSGRTSIPKILPGPMPIPPKMEAVPPPPHPNTSLPGAPPPARPQAKVEAPAPVPPPTRLTYPPITPRTPGQSVWPVTPAPAQSMQMAGQQAQGSPPSMGSLHQLADVVDSRRKQKHPPPSRPPYQQYPALGLPDRIQPVICTPIYDRATASAGPALPSGGYGILYPPQTPSTPAPIQQQYSQTQPRPIAAAPVTTFQQYTPTPAAPAQQPRQPAQASSVPRVSPVSQKITPRPSPIPQTSYVSPRKAPPPPINTGTPVHAPSIPVQPMASEEELASPGSPIPPRPDEISPISTPGGSPRVLSPKPIVIEKICSKKRLFGESKFVEISPENEDEGSTEKSPDGKPPPKKQKSSKADKKATGKPPGRVSVVRTSSAEPPPSKVTRSASAETERRASRSPSTEPLPANKQKAAKTVVSPISEGSEVKDEELSEIDNDDAIMASPAPARKGKEVEGKKTGNGRATRKTSASGRKADAEATEREDTISQTPRSKPPKRKRNPSQSDAEEESKGETTTVSPRKPFHRPPKLEPQNSSITTGIGSPLPTGVAIGQQQMVVATKKFLQLSAPLLGDISSHKFANLFTNPVNERLAPGYRNLVYKPEDLKCNPLSLLHIKDSKANNLTAIKAAVKAGAAVVTNASTGTPAITTPTTESIAASTPPANASTFTTLPATTLNTPPKGIVNSVQLEKELFRMFANAMMYNKSTSEIAKETVVMARDVEGMVDNFRTAEEAGMKKALCASFGPAKKSGGAGGGSAGGAGSERERERERTAGTVAEEGEEGEGSTVAGAEEESMAGEGTEKEIEDGGGGGQEGKKKVGRKKKRR
ncbi:hypothetical protein C7212DRAFT_365497 [Tuber magnatum]|uniref:Bromo domain-containing protein n=1 Tax=Tuber magnatum TaxID=42249 RepID=A0A317SJX2_9PEZI|nr:hypothetical protein C7212DRAFT_365497 [Tuber magnatum]